jgi:hypothetical protein
VKTKKTSNILDGTDEPDTIDEPYVGCEFRKR